MSKVPNKEGKKVRELTSVSSERAVLAALCRYGDEFLTDINGVINEETFTLDHNKILFKCALDSSKNRSSVQFVDIMSSAEKLDLTEYVNTQEVIKHIHGVINTPIEIDNAASHIKVLRRLQYARDLRRALKSSYEDLSKITGDESLSIIMSCAESPIQKLSLSYIREEDTKPKKIGDTIDDYIDSLNEVKNIIGISSGFPSYDRAIGGGFRRKCVDLVGARMKVGKSQFADNVAIHVAKNLGIPVLMLDTEMSTTDHHNRLLSNLADVSVNDIPTGKFNLDNNKKFKIREASNVIKSIPYYYINISGKQFDETLSIIKRWIMKEVGYDENGNTKDCLIIYDYLKLMSSESISKNVAEYQALGFQITQLHNFMVENDCACLSFVQLNRDGITSEDTDSVSGSDRLLWLCTSYSIFKVKAQEEIDVDGIENGNRKLIPVVARHGSANNDDGYICLDMKGEFSRITEIGQIRKLKKSKDKSFPTEGGTDEKGQPKDF